MQRLSLSGCWKAPRAYTDFRSLVQAGDMRAFSLRVKDECLRHKGALGSAMLHGVAILWLAGGIGHSPRLMPYRLPGTAKGDTLLTYYMPGSVHSLASQTRDKSAEKAIAKPETPRIQMTPAADMPHTPEAKAGVEAAAESGLGEGEIKIALLSYFPYPAPDLTSLPHGTKGDVILNAVIDEDGKITALTLLKGLGMSVDQSVIATVQQWRYKPAMKNGVPIVSEQELHFHYERS